jgi:hypothetical protein
MRELANQSARSALGMHETASWRRAAWGKMCVAGVALLAGIIQMILSPSVYSVGVVGGWAGFMIAVYWGLQSVVLFKQARLKDQRDNEEKAK